MAQECVAARSAVCYLLLAPELGALKTKVNVGRSCAARSLYRQATASLSVPLFSFALPFSSFVRQTQLLHRLGCLP